MVNLDPDPVTSDDKVIRLLMLTEYRLPMYDIDTVAMLKTKTKNLYKVQDVELLYNKVKSM